MSKLSELVEFNPSVRLKRGEVAPFIEMAALPTNARDIPLLGVREFSGSGSKFQNGDTLFARITPCLENGKGGYVSTLGAAAAGHGSTEFIVLRARSQTDSLFIYYITREPEFRRFAEKQMSGTSGRQRVAWQSLAEYELPEIEPSQRAAIAATLGALDDKIELNRKMNATLETMARTLFRDWFVDFGPTRAKMEARTPYLSPDLWPLFPDCLDDERKPEGWEVSQLDALAEVNMGISPDGSTYNEDGLGTPLCNGPVEYGDFFLRQIKWTTAPSKLAQRGDLIICVRGSTTGRHAFADAEYCLGRGVASIRGKDDGQEFVETALLSQMNRLLEKTTGSVFPSLSTQDIKKFGLIDPGPALRQVFCNAVRPIRAKIWANVENPRTLAQTRDLLLPRLMSGELRVADLTPSEQETAA